MSTRYAFAAVVILQLAFLGGESAWLSSSMRTGQTIVLQVRPVDPRSLFSGHYMALNPTATDIDTGRVSTPGGFAIGESVYVGFRPARPYAVPVSVSRVLTPAPNLVPVKGVVTGRYGGHLRVDYGISRYYIPETRQEEVNRMWWSGERQQVAVVLKVDRRGNALIEHVEVNGKALTY